MSDLTNGDPAQVGGPQIGVDAQDEETEVTQVVGQQFFDGFYISDLTDRFDSDGGPFFRMIWIFAHRLLTPAGNITFANLCLKLI